MREETDDRVQSNGQREMNVHARAILDVSNITLSSFLVNSNPKRHLQQDHFYSKIQQIRLGAMTM